MSWFGTMKFVLPRKLGITVLCLAMTTVAVLRLRYQLDVDRFLVTPSSETSTDSSYDLPRKKYIPGNPSFILHVGPSKTGTTTLQKDGANFTVPLAEDGYVYLGREMPRSVGRTTVLNWMLQQAKCYVEMEQDYYNNTDGEFTVQSLCFQKVLDELDRRWNQSIIISAEEFSYQRRLDKLNNVSFYYEVLSAAFEHWNVLIVGGYRRYSEWILSAVKQVDATTCMQKNEWPHQGGSPCFSPWQRISSWMARPTTSARHYRFIDEHLPEWERHGFKTAILNFHSGHPTTSFFCDVVDDTPATCRHSQERPVQPAVNARKVDTAAYDSIVFAAAQRGLIDVHNQTRSEAATKLAEYHQLDLGLGFTDLPLRCPTRDQLEELLEKSLALEEKLLPDFYHSPDGEVEHRASFWRMAEENKEYCSVDTTSLLKHATSWDEVLERIEWHGMQRDKD